MAASGLPLIRRSLEGELRKGSAAFLLDAVRVEDYAAALSALSVRAGPRQEVVDAEPGSPGITWRAQWH
jgi:hypothetical protein